MRGGWCKSGVSRPLRTEKRKAENKAMAYVRIQGNQYYAVYRVKGKQVNRATGVPVKEAGRKAAQLKKDALLRAETMERVAKGETTLQKGLDALRAVAMVNGGAAIPTVREYLTGFDGGAGAKTEANRKRACGVLLEYLGADADMRLDALSRETMLDFLRWSLKRVSKGTVGLYKNMLATVFNRAVDDELLTRSPFPRIVKLEALARDVNPELTCDKVNRLPFTPDELRIIFDRFPAPWCDLAFVSFALGGQRLGDVCCLRWDAVDFGKGLVYLVTHKTNKGLGVPLDARLRARLLAIRAGQDAGEVYVFPWLACRYLRAASNVSTEFTALLRAHGIIEAGGKSELKGDRKRVSRKSFHSLRHSFVSLGRCAVGVVPDVMRAVVGHDDEGIERGYVAASHGQMRAAVAGVLDVVEGTGAGN